MANVGAAKRTARERAAVAEGRGSRLAAIRGGLAEGQRLSREELEQKARAHALAEVTRLRRVDCKSAKPEADAQAIAVAAAALFSGAARPSFDETTADQSLAARIARARSAWAQSRPDSSGQSKGRASWHPEDLLLAEFWRLLQGSDGARRASDRGRRRAADRCRVCDEKLAPDAPCPSCGAEASVARGAAPAAWWGRRKGTPRDLALLLVLGGAVTHGDWTAWARANATPDEVLERLAGRIKTRLGERRAALRRKRRESTVGRSG